MAGFRNISELANAQNNGQGFLGSFVKTPSINAGAAWYDLGYTGGYPAPNYYASTPLKAAAMARSTDNGINHGPHAPAGMTKWLRKLTILPYANMIPAYYYLLDYLMYYPFIDTSDSSVQTLDNTVTLPRYATGEGVYILPVCQAPDTGYPVARVTYTNSDGVSGRQVIYAQGFVTYTAAIGTKNQGAGYTAYNNAPFLRLMDRDKGVRSIESVEYFANNGIGLWSFILVKPLLTFGVFESGAPVEIDTLLTKPVMPRIMDDACLNLMLYNVGITTAAKTVGLIETVWN